VVRCSVVLRSESPAKLERELRTWMDAARLGFGGGSGSGEDPKKAGAKGTGAGAGGGGGIRPIALVIVDKDGKIRVESVRASTSIVDKVGDAVVRAVEATRTAKEQASA
jgi:uncharacterized spore protein YtfJ